MKHEFLNGDALEEIIVDASFIQVKIAKKRMDDLIDQKK